MKDFAIDSVEVLHCGRILYEENKETIQVHQSRFKDSSPVVKFLVGDFLYFSEIPHLYNFLR